MNTTQTMLKELNKAQSSQKTLAKVRGKLCGRNEPMRTRVLRMEHMLADYRKELIQYVFDNSKDLVHVEETPLPELGRFD